MKTIDFYLDFLSPYSYLANQRLQNMAAKYGCVLRYHPIDLKAAKLAAGNDGPATVQMPVKLRYVMQDLNRWAQRYGLPLAFAQVPPVTDRVNKGLFYAADRDCASAYASAVWSATFACAGEFNSDVVLRQVASQMSWDEEDFLSFVSSERADERYSNSNAQAQSLGVFGAPTIIVEGEMWWGNDRLDFLEEYLAENCASA